MNTDTATHTSLRSGSLRFGIVFALFAVLAIFPASCSAAPRPQRLPLSEIEIGGRRIAVEVARTEEQRTTGMMHRLKIGPDEGMLFAFPRDRVRSFYMKNTHIPLSIAFISAEGVILNIAHMEPRTLDSHRSRLPCRFALEMPQGWFARHGVTEGARVVLPEGISAEE